jgi:hypothetical protein
MGRLEKFTTSTLLLGLIIFVSATVAMCAFSEDDRDEAKPSPTAWRHLALTNIIGETPKTELAANITKLGREGWELVSVDSIEESGTTTQTVFYFKKPL